MERVNKLTATNVQLSPPNSRLLGEMRVSPAALPEIVLTTTYVEPSGAKKPKNATKMRL